MDPIEVENEKRKLVVMCALSEIAAGILANPAESGSTPEDVAKRACDVWTALNEEMGRRCG